MADDAEDPQHEMVWVDGGLPPVPSQLVSIQRFNTFLRDQGFPLRTYLQRLKTESKLAGARKRVIAALFAAYEQHEFRPDTFNLAVNYSDLYMARAQGYIDPTSRKAIETFAFSCLQVASKAFEPMIRSDDQWCETFLIEKKDLIRRKAKLREILGGDMKIPTISSFMEYYKNTMSCDFFQDPTNILIHSLIDTCFLDFLPSEVGAALSLVFCLPGLNTSNVLFEDTTVERVEECAMKLFDLIKRCNLAACISFTLYQPFDFLYY